jgi:hypothetical protein
MYAAITTRPDITFVVSSLSCFLNNPGNAHWEANKCVFHYLKGTQASQLTFSGKQHELEGFCDADGTTQEDYHAISGYAFKVNGGAISWSAKKQELITLSMAEAKYIAATVGSKSVAMFFSFRLFAVWHFMEWKSHLAL